MSAAAGRTDDLDRDRHGNASGRKVMLTRRGPDWLHPGWSWTVGRAWVITALSASVTLILGAALGALPALIAGSWSDPQTRLQAWVLIGFTAAGLVAASIAVASFGPRRSGNPQTARRKRPLGPHQ